MFDFRKSDLLKNNLSICSGIGQAIQKTFHEFYKYFKAQKFRILLQ